MFTGIVQGLGKVTHVLKGNAVWTFTIALPDASGLQQGGSVAVQGTCLTATEINESEVKFDVIPETLERTNLGQLNVGDAVNIERSLKMGDELGGHLLSGHIMGQAEVISCQQQGAGMDLLLKVPKSMMKFIHEKGYIGLNGASLTIGKVTDSSFNIHLIPETLALTTFDQMGSGHMVNVEIDAMTQTTVATVERMMKGEN